MNKRHSKGIPGSWPPLGCEYERLNLKYSTFLRSVWGTTIYMFPGAAKLTQDSALRSDRIQVLVGENKKDFQVPRDPFANCSPSLTLHMYNSALRSQSKGSLDFLRSTPQRLEILSSGCIRVLLLKPHVRYSIVVPLIVQLWL